MTICILVLFVFIALGKVFDLLTYKEEKLNIYYKAQRFLAKNRTTKFPEIHLNAISQFLNTYYKIINFKKKPIKTILKLFVISWTFSTVIYWLGEFWEPRYYKYWHDYFPWYPIYIVNFIFDSITIFITVQILKWIKDKNIFLVFMGLLLDFILAYSFFILCLISIPVGQNLASELDIGSNFIHHRKFSGHLQGNQRNIPFTKEKLLNAQISARTYDILKKKGFTAEATIHFVDTNRNVKLFEKVIQLFNIKHLYHTLFKQRKLLVDYMNNYVIKEGELEYEFSTISKGFLLSFGIITISTTTLIPTVLFLFFLFALYISKEVFIIYKSFSTRIIKTSLVDEDEIEKFRPGTHIGIVIGLIISVLKIIQEIIA